MKKLFHLLLFVQLTLASASQIPGIQWQKPFGGTGGEIFFHQMQKTSDGGFFVTLKNYSTDGDFPSMPGSIVLIKINKNGYQEWVKQICNAAVTQTLFSINSSLITANDDLYLFGESLASNHGGYDIWVAKITKAGDVVWQKSFGGSGNDKFGSFYMDSDGNLVVASQTNSATGDVKGPFKGGASDLWLFKLNSNGTILWSQCYGGSGHDFRDGVVIKELGNEYFITTETTSNTGDATGNHGSWDIWFFKTNKSGALQWQIQLGGAEIEASKDFVATSSGGFYVLGYSYSTTIPNTHTNTIDPDLYVAKISSEGALEWQKAFGGAFTEAPITIFSEEDGGCVIFSNVTTINRVNGDIISSSGSRTDTEIWAFKMNVDGTIAWQRCLGGSGADGAIKIIEEKLDDDNNPLPDVNKSYILLGRTQSTNRDVVGYHSNPQYQYPDIWLAKMKKSDRSILWSRCMGGKFDEMPYGVLQINRNEFLIGGYTESNDGDVVGHHGSYDAWIVKFGPANMIKGNVFLDLNSNGVKDGNEKNLNNIHVQSEKLNDKKVSVTAKGIFQNDADTGTYLTSVASQVPYFSNPPSRQTSFAQYNLKDSFGLGLLPQPNHKDLRIFLVARDNPRPNFFGEYYIFCTNVGSQTVNSPVVKFIKNSRTTWGASIPNASSLLNDTASWIFPSLAPYDTVRIQVSVNIPAPPLFNMGDIISSVASVSSSQPEETPIDNKDSLVQVLLDSWDPNDKKESHNGTMARSAIQSGSHLSYLVRFQNTGTAPAINIKIRDTLDAKLDWSSLQVIASSHPYKLNIENGDKCTWVYENINLPDSNANEPASHGFVAYRIKPLNSVAPGDIVYNSASIYFDFNLPVRTNIEETVISATQLEPNITSFTPTSGANGTSVTITGTNLTGATVVSFGGIAATSFTVNSATSITAVVGTGASGNVGVTTPGGTATLGDFTFVGAPTITSFTPTNGVNGTAVTITGTNLTGATSVSFGGTAATSFTINSATSITAIVGAGASGNVSVTTPEGTTTLAGFIFIPQPTITSFTPASAAAGASVTITGTNFTGATAVSLGGIAATSFTVNSSTSITAVIGVGASGNVSVTTLGGIGTLAGFTFIPQPTITSFTPTSAAAGASVTIIGTNFTGATAVRFGGIAATSFTINSATSITAVVGTGASGNVSVTTPGGTATKAGFIFIPQPTITSFTPASAAAGASITITGSNFTGATAVNFGGIAATSFTVNSSTSIIAVIGAGASGNVSVTTPGGTAILAGFIFVPAPTITSFTPTSGATGASATITGTNFTGATVVSFGGIAATSFTVNSSTSITAIVGTGASGNVSVTTPGGTATLAGFTFIPQPTISSFTPASGAAGTSITITGTNFTGATAVSFGGVATSSFTVNSATSITAVVGTGASGNVSITTAGGTATLAGFTFIPQPTISSFTPASGAAGTSITITGTNFIGATAVSFGGVAATSFVINSTTSISAVVGTGASGDITVTTPYGTATAGRFAFEPSQDNNELIIYPNPADEFVQVKHPSTELPAQLRVIDLAGKVVKVIIVERNAIETRIDLKGLQQGIYEVVWSDGKNKASQKLMLYK